MKHTSLMSSLVLSMLGVQSACAAYASDYIGNNTGNTSAALRAELEINEFIVLDTMSDLTLFYLPYSATKANITNAEDAPGGAGSVYVGGALVYFHGNIPMQLSVSNLDKVRMVWPSNVVWFFPGNSLDSIQIIYDFDETNEINSATDYFDKVFFDVEITLDENKVINGSADMLHAYTMSGDAITKIDPQIGSVSGKTDFVRKLYHRVVMGDHKDMELFGIYRGEVMIRLVPVPAV
ncbi:MAG: hypothetical protein QGG88_08405 [Gammaproteobacteria bacterium]|nr:hypothetical protein [Gammaproteobacteria bacterium]